MLFPGNLSIPPMIPSDIFDSHKPPGPSPLIVNLADQLLSSYSGLPGLSPLIIPRNHPVWCTDRFFIHNTRAADWKECLWQFWVESFGAFGNMRATIKTSESFTLEVDTTVSPPRTHVRLLPAELWKDAIRNRFSVRFRAETCDLAARTMATLGVKNYKDGKKKLAWLKQTCGQASIRSFLPSR
jgi:hypothetical protein